MDHKAVFSFKDYQFTEAHLNMALLPDHAEEITPRFGVAGRYDKSSGNYALELKFEALTSTGEACVQVVCTANYQFGEPIDLDHIPSFFFANAIAIVFPYIRAFVSTLTLQANFQPFVLPTMNLTSLAEGLKQNTQTYE